MTGSKDPHSGDHAEELQGFDAFEFRLGDEMRGERATLGKSLLDVQRELKIKASYIAAIENADPNAFDSKGFIAGFVRSYARYLGMDPDESFRRFCEESGFETPRGPAATTKAPSNKTPVKSRSKSANDPLLTAKTAFVPERSGFFSQLEAGALGSSLVLLALIAALGYGGWSVLQQVQQVNLTPVEDAPEVLAVVDPLVGASTPAAEEDEEREAALVRLYRPQALDVPVLEARDGPIATIDPRAMGVLANEQQRLEQIALDSLPTLPDLPEPVQVVEPVAPELAIIAVRPAWVRVSGADGSVLFEKILESGERYIIPSTEQAPLLRAGNSGAVYFAVNGETFGPAGDGGSVAKNVELSVEAVQGVYEVADLASDPDMASIVALAKAPAPEAEAE
ncbi:helix-turn-helix domain-containing protein [Actibacterium pelagium]|uniref:4-hydroxy-3-methylbut-2-en-1-yl diphosphate synthase n=1 Tax=Actibacterium pelagium TaxID=2029103 RepID=A0A917EJX0_9RHOB|nr:helix-turn-helix domain-containing protein [Actibacterium pelagium]GGE45331.1 4-hydroxy-3-methylbut-2-en-1-yl diphosphate synthase [Actibacterium pelagium]